MKFSNIFIIILKTLGIVFLKSILDLLLQILSSVIYPLSGERSNVENVTVVYLLTVLSVYVFVAYCLIFKADAIVRRLKLDQGLEASNSGGAIPASSILTIALIAIGGYFLIDEIPNCVRFLYNYIQSQRLPQDRLKSNFSYFYFSIAKILIGLLLIGERKRIVDFIQRKQLVEADQVL